MTELRSPAELAALAEVMVELGCEIEQLGALLCADAELVGRHARELQAIDLIAQMQQALARLMDADCMTCAIDEMRLEGLRDRLGNCLPAGQCDHANHRHHRHAPNH